VRRVFLYFRHQLKLFKEEKTKTLISLCVYVFESIQVGPIHWFVVANGCSYNNMYIVRVSVVCVFLCVEKTEGLL